MGGGAGKRGKHTETKPYRVSVVYLRARCTYAVNGVTEVTQQERCRAAVGPLGESSDEERVPGLCHGGLVHDGVDLEGFLARGSMPGPVSPPSVTGREGLAKPARNLWKQERTEQVVLQYGRFLQPPHFRTLPMITLTQPAQYQTLGGGTADMEREREPTTAEGML